MVSAKQPNIDGMDEMSFSRAVPYWARREVRAACDNVDRGGLTDAVWGGSYGWPLAWIGSARFRRPPPSSGLRYPDYVPTPPNRIIWLGVIPNMVVWIVMGFVVVRTLDCLQRVLAGVFTWLGTACQPRPRPKGMCPECDYDLTDLSQGAGCPECGWGR